MVFRKTCSISEFQNFLQWVGFLLTRMRLPPSQAGREHINPQSHVLIIYSYDDMQCLPLAFPGLKILSLCHGTGTPAPGRFLLGPVIILQ
jgi:hypothetical protein